MSNLFRISFAYFCIGIYFFPDISIAEHGAIDVEPLAVVLDNTRKGLESEFMKMHPKKLIFELKELKEDVSVV